MEKRRFGTSSGENGAMLLEAIQVGLVIAAAFAIAFLMYRMMQLYALFQKSGPRP